MNPAGRTKASVGPEGRTERKNLLQRVSVMAEAIQHDILIIGGGGAGLRAAIAVAEHDPDLSVALVSKV